MSPLASILRSSFGILVLLFQFPSLLEHFWIDRHNRNYKTSASTTFGASVAMLLVYVFALSDYFPRSDFVFFTAVAIIAVAVLTVVAIWRFETWSHSPKILSWFLCQALFAFLGWLAFLAVVAVLLMIIGIVLPIQLLLWVTHVNVNAERFVPNTDRVREFFENAANSAPASGSGQHVESQDMFNGELKQTQGLGPDTTLVHDESQDSIYGNTYVDKDTGKEYRVTETDAFGHPTKVEEKWP